MTSLPVLPPGFAESRRALHLITFYAFSYARQLVEDEVWCVPTPGGLGTPSFEERVLRVEGLDLVEEIGGVETNRERISTLRAALAFAGVEFDRARGERNDVEIPHDLDEVFNIDPRAVSALAAFYAIGAEVLEDVLAGAVDGEETAVRLWNEHFDLAIEVGSEERHRRASVGFSPGDEHIPVPYVYVVAWWKDETAHLLSPTAPFGGVALTYGELRSSTDPAAAARAFITGALARLDD